MPLALIVDDSRTARYALQMLLERAGFSVDSVASGEASLTYLRDRRERGEEQGVDLIFMDHMMPGMDGFAAVKAIKADAATAAIPIIMYTSREGEVYFGQARALGAADVLAKPASAVDLQRVLERLHERGLMGEPRADEPSPRLAEAPLAALAAEPEIPLPLPASPPLTAQMPAAAPAQGVDLGDGPGWRPLLWLALALLPLLWVVSLYIPAEQHRQELIAREAALYRLVQSTLDRSGEYPFGELALSGERLEVLRELVSQLHGLGFRGRLRLESHAGEFCLVPAPPEEGRWTLPAARASLADCAAIGLPAREAMAMTEQQSAEFRRFVDTSPLLGDARIRIETVGYGIDQPLHAYPLDGAVVTAGAWNAVAARNQRVRFVLLPDTPEEVRPFWRRLFGF